MPPPNRPPILWRPTTPKVPDTNYGHPDVHRLAAHYGHEALWEVSLFVLEFPPSWVLTADEVELLTIALDLYQNPISKR